MFRAYYWSFIPPFFLQNSPKADRKLTRRCNSNMRSKYISAIHHGKVRPRWRMMDLQRLPNMAAKSIPKTFIVWLTSKNSICPLQKKSFLYFRKTEEVHLRIFMLVHFNEGRRRHTSLPFLAFANVFNPNI